LIWTKSKNTNNLREVGSNAESLVVSHLQKFGLTLVQLNFQFKQGEIDIIMKDKNTWVFIEVKYRKTEGFGGPLSAISKSKQQKIRRCASFFLQNNGLNEYNAACRFDAVALVGDLQSPQITWLKNAF